MTIKLNWIYGTVSVGQSQQQATMANNKKKSWWRDIFHLCPDEQENECDCRMLSRKSSSLYTREWNERRHCLVINSSLLSRFSSFHFLNLQHDMFIHPCLRLLCYDYRRALHLHVWFDQHLIFTRHDRLTILICDVPAWNLGISSHRIWFRFDYFVFHREVEQQRGVQTSIK
jgi:hypothetical protein